MTTNFVAMVDISITSHARSVMTLSWKPDWPEAKDRWTAFWHGEMIDRPILLLTAPKSDPPDTSIPEDAAFHWTDSGHQVRWLEARNLGSTYFAEAIPSANGPLAAWCAYYGGRTGFLPDTIWHEPLFDDWDDAPEWETAWRDAGYLHLLEMVEQLCKSRIGRGYVGFPPTLHAAPSDLLAAMRGTDRYLFDLVERPETVIDATVRMSRNFARVYDEIFELIHSFGFEGYGNWWPIWCPEPMAVFQSDVSCMISGEMFDRFVTPHLEITASHVTHGFYHLDGPDAIRHVERVCGIPQIKAIQWVPGAGTEPGAVQWLELFRTIQSHGCAVYCGAAPDEIETLIRELDPSRLIIGVGVKNDDAAMRLIDDTVRWTAGYGETRRSGRGLASFTS